MKEYNKFNGLNKSFNIELTENNMEDLRSYCIKLYHDKGIPINYNKIIKKALKSYLDKHIGEEDLKKIEKMKFAGII